MSYSKLENMNENAWNVPCEWDGPESEKDGAISE